MREILFRGKRKDTGALETGSLVIVRGGCSDEQVFITDKMTGYCTPVIPETVGQYTGLTDKNGKKIFEGDIVNIEYLETTVKNAVIEYVGASFYGSTDSDACELDGYYQLEVIGNIHDNPELLGRSNR